MYYQRDIFGNLSSLEKLYEARLDTLFEQGVICPECGKEVKDRFSLYEKDGRVGHIECLAQDEELVTCYSCGRVLLKDQAVPVEVFDDPWDKEPVIIYVCPYEWGPLMQRGEYWGSCYDILFDTSWADFRYFECYSCGRIVIRQSPYNGWHSYVRIDYETEEEICLKCYEEDILKNGIPKEPFARGEIPGMFFGQGNLEVLRAGYKEVDGYRYVFIRSDESVKNFCDKAIKLIDEGYKVIVAYESMAIGGLEGTVSLYAKKEV